MRCRRHRLHDLVLADFLSLHVAPAASLVKEFEDRGLAHIALAAHDVAEVVAVEPAGGGDDQEILAAGFELMTFQRHGLSRFHFADRNELVIVAVDRQDSLWTGILEWDRVVALG